MIGDALVLGSMWLITVTLMWIVDPYRVDR